MSAIIQKLLSYYSSENPGVKSYIYRLLTSGALAGSGRMIIYPVDQGFEHGPDASFSSNINAYDPEYHVKLSIEAGLSAYAAPLGMIEMIANDYAGQIPLILKLNSSNKLYKGEPDQAITANVEDALKLGCVGIGLTIYPGSAMSLQMFEEAQAIINKAKKYGLASIIWAYPRGDNSQNLEVMAYSAHIACLLGANIIKIKLPPNKNDISHIVRSCFNGKRLVLFSGGEYKNDEEMLNEAKAIIKSGGAGSMIGRNCFQRSKESALVLLRNLIEVYKHEN